MQTDGAKRSIIVTTLGFVLSSSKTRSIKCCRLAWSGSTRRQGKLMPVRFACATALVESRFAGLAIGDWATWTGSFLAGLSLLLLVTGSLRDRSERRWLERSVQARSVGAWLEFIDSFEADELWELS